MLKVLPGKAFEKNCKIPAGSLLGKTNFTKNAQSPANTAFAGFFFGTCYTKKYQRITYSGGVIRASFQIFKKSTLEFS
jgi:hypothetical protein